MTFLTWRSSGLEFDITDSPRLTATYRRDGDRFLRRLYTDGEIAYCMRRRDRVSSRAGRFAPKEAAMKALGMGHLQDVLWKDIEAVRHGGPPQLRLHGGAASLAEAMGGRKLQVTLTHSEALAMAQVITPQAEASRRLPTGRPAGCRRPVTMCDSA